MARRLARAAGFADLGRPVELVERSVRRGEGEIPSSLTPSESG